MILNITDNMKLVVRTSRFVTFLSVTGLSFLATMFIFANVLERIFIIDIPLVSSVQVTNTPILIAQINTDNAGQIVNKHGYYGKPQTVRVPKMNLAFGLQDSKQGEKGWLVNNNSASIYTFSESNAGNLGNSLIFGGNNSKVIGFVEKMDIDDRIIIDTSEGWRYSYRITKKIVIDDSLRYFVDEIGASRIVFMGKEQSGGVTLIEGTILSVEERGA